MTTHVFTITCLTNLHAGAGDNGGTNVVDKAVQRDPTTNLPTIHASAIKGALREHFKLDGIDSKTLEKIFGSSNKPEKEEGTEAKKPEGRDPKKMVQGDHRFFAADLLALPSPIDAAPHFERIGDEKSANAIAARLKLLGSKATLDLKSKADKLDAIGFKILAEELPVIARNFLDNGVSKNLWYEEIVPREAVFVVAFQSKEATSELIDALDNQVIQLGGNATVGYGFCLFQKHPKTTDQ